jgi:hypothetical protein
VKVIVAEVEDFEFAPKVAVHEVPDGNPFSVKVMEYVLGVDAKFAVIVPGPFTVAVVGDDVEEANIIEVVLLDQLLKL